MILKPCAMPITVDYFNLVLVFIFCFLFCFLVLPLISEKMEEPGLYGKGEGQVLIHKHIFEKYWHFIRWSSLPENIIDVGIGNGQVTQNVILPLLPKYIEQYLGADVAEVMLDFSKTVIKHPRYQTIQLDICSKDIPLQLQNKFEKVFACFLLHMLSSNVP